MTDKAECNGAASRPRPDRLTREGAAKLARGIETFWHRRGLDQVRAWTEPIPSTRDDKFHDAFGVRSNLTGVVPPAIARVTPIRIENIATEEASA